MARIRAAECAAGRGWLDHGFRHGRDVPPDPARVVVAVPPVDLLAVGGGVLEMKFMDVWGCFLLRHQTASRCVANAPFSRQQSLQTVTYYMLRI
ncbi:hypothetical protein Pelo_1031 [Pelomyxa schiedti]|nr:hypothetical protein Pelo_1031 [Pelomyxa schiedti]